MSQSKLRKYLEAFSIWSMLASFMWVKPGFQEDKLKIQLVCLDFAILWGTNIQGWSMNQEQEEFLLGNCCRALIGENMAPEHPLSTLQLFSGPSLGRCCLSKVWAEVQSSPSTRSPIKASVTLSRNTRGLKLSTGKLLMMPLTLRQL